MSETVYYKPPVELVIYFILFSFESISCQPHRWCNG